jgi:hypothetical protein
MSVARIFEQLHDPTTWPAPPPRALVPAGLADLRPPLRPLEPAVLERWTPPPPENG